MAVYQDTLGLSARRVMESASLTARPTLWDLAALHLAARCETVCLWHPDRGHHLLERGGRSSVAFLEQLNAVTPADLTPSPVFTPPGPVLGAFLHRNRALPPGSEAFALRDSVVEELDVQRREFAAALADLGFSARA